MGSPRSIYFGEKSHDFPGPEILQDFNPADHLTGFGNNRNIAHIPGHDNLLLRWSPSRNGRKLWLINRGRSLSEDALLDLAGHSAEQYRLFEDCGVGVASTRTFAGEAPSNVNVQGTVLYSVIERLTGEPLHCETDKRGIPIVLGLARVILSPTRANLLSDVWGAHQYMEQDSKGMLQDVEPPFIHLNTDDIYRFAEHEASKNIWGWARSLGIAGHDLMQQIAIKQKTNNKIQ